MTQTPTCTSISGEQHAKGREPGSTENATLADVVAAAVRGDHDAWNDLVGRFDPLVSSLVRRYRLTEHDADDVRQTVWLRMLEHLKDLREPRALPGWIVSTTKHEAIRVLGAQRRVEVADPVDQRLVNIVRDEPGDDLLRAERRRVVRAGIAQLRPQLRELVDLVFDEERLSYQQISAVLGIPIGSIGPTRARCVDKLRSNSAIQALAS